MSGPWENYAPPASAEPKPWEKYGAQPEPDLALSVTPQTGGGTLLPDATLALPEGAPALVDQPLGDVIRGVERGHPIDAVTRGATSLLASGIHTGSDFLDQVMTPTRAIYGENPLGFDQAAAQALGVEQEINADRQDAATRIGGRPGLGDLLQRPDAAIEQAVANITNQGGESIPAMLLALATRSPELGSAVMGVTTGAQEYTDLRGQGVERATAATSAGLTGAIESAGEGIGLPAIMAKRGEGSLLRAVTENALQEAPVQVAQTQVEDQATGHETPLLEQLSQAIDAATVGGVLGGGGHVASNLSDFTRAVAERPAPRAPAQPVAPAAEAVPPAAKPTPVAPPVAAPVTSDDEAELDALLAGKPETGDTEAVAAAKRAQMEAEIARREQAKAEIERRTAELDKAHTPARGLNAKPDESVDDALTFLAKHGGLARSEFVKQGVDPAQTRLPEYRSHGGMGRPLFRAKDGNGLTLDQAAERLWQHGYLPSQDNNAALDLIMGGLGGEPTYSIHRADQSERMALEQQRRDLESAPPVDDYADVPFSFAGERARTADRGALDDAKQMEAMGRDSVPDRFGNQPGSPEDTHMATGWHRGVDGKWRFEIDDSAATLKPAFQTRLNTIAHLTAEAEGLAQPEHGGSPSAEDAGRAARIRDKVASLRDGLKVGDLIDHPALLEAYPDLADVRVRVIPGMKGLGAYSAAGNAIEIHPPAQYPPSGDRSLKSVLLHEIQHAIQNREGFARGGSTAEFQNELSQKRQKVRQEMRELEQRYRYGDPGYEQVQEKLAELDRLDTEARGKYHALAGEVESRNVQRRMNMGKDERRAVPPSETADVPRHQQIVRFNGGTANAEGFTDADRQAVERYNTALSRYFGADVLLTPAADVPDAARRALDAFDRAYGGRTLVVRNGSPEAFDFNGVTLRDGHRLLNEDATSPLLTVAGHEMVHQMRKDAPDLYAELEAEVRRQGHLASYGAVLADRAKRNGETREFPEHEVVEELTADAAGDALTDPGFIDRLARKNPGLFQRFARYAMDFLASLGRRLRSLGSSHFLNDVSAFRDTLADVLERYATRQQGIGSAPQGQAERDPSLQRVFHGTPHTVDKFSLQKIGTGEGAQAYGWGMYFASSKEIADHYRRGLSTRDFIAKARDAYDEYSSPDEAIDALRSIDGLSEPQKELLDALKADGWLGFDYPHQAISAALKQPQNFELSPATEAALAKQGNLYHVEVPEDHDLLDWDKPLSAQPEKVKDALQDAGIYPEWRKQEALNKTVSAIDLSNQANVPEWRRISEDMSRIRGDHGLGPVANGSAVYSALQGRRKSPKAASEYLNSIGIPGLRYLDGASRSKGEGSANYVIWDEGAIGDPEHALSRKPVDDQTDTPAFKKWFGDSAVVDAEGKPLVVYHGTGANGIDVFNNAKAARGMDKNANGVAWFSSAPEVASEFAGHQVGETFMRGTPHEFTTGHSTVYPVYLSIKNPMIDHRGQYAKFGGLTRNVVDELRDEGYDGIIWPESDHDLPDTTDQGPVKGYRRDRNGRVYGEEVSYPSQYAVFSPEQIKSATGNAGTFDPENPSILFSRKPAYTDEQKAFLRKAGMSEAVDERSATARALDLLRGAKPEVDGDAFRQGALDKFHGLKRAVDEKGGIAPEDSPYLAAEMIQTASTMEAVLRFGAPELHQGALRVNRNVPGLLDALTPVKDAMPQWLGWMVARRAQVLKAQGRENALSDTDIAAGLSLAKGREAEFKAAALGYLKLKNAILDLAEQTGIIDPDARKAWDHAEYIPFYRDMDTGAGGPGTRQGLANQSSGIRTLKGGQAPLKDPLGNIIANFTRLIDASMKNRATLLAVDQLGSPYFRKAPLAVKAETIPLDQVKKHLQDQGVDPATIASMPPAALKGVARMLAVKAPEGDDIVRVMRGGKAEYYHVDDPLLLRALTAFNEGGTHGAIKVLAWFKNLLTAGATATPDFLLRNAIRDTGEATVTAPDRFVPVWDTLRGAVASFRESELAQDLMMAGAAFHGGLFHTGNNEDTAKAIKRALRKHGLTDSAVERYVRTLINPKRLWDAYRSVSEATEMGSRVSLARNRVKAGASFVEAAHEAKDFLNFQRRGDDKFMQAFTKMIPFLNARLQGADRLYRMGTTKGRRGRVATRLAYMALLSTLLYWWNDREYKDAYDELPDWDKDANWHIAPGTAYHLRIPKPFELGLAGGTLPERLYGALKYQLTDGREGDRPVQSWDAFMRALWSTMGLNPIPQGAMPIIEDIAGKDFYFGNRIESMGDQYKAPSDRAGPTTSPTMQAASKGMAALVGEDYTLSPKRLEHLWRGYTAGMGQYLLQSADWVTRQIEHAPATPAAALRDYPLVGTVARGDGPARSTRYVDEFYDLLEQAQTQSGKVKEALHNGDPRRAANVEKAWGWLLGARQGSRRAKAGFMHGGLREMDRVRDTLAEISKDNARIYADPKMSAQAKRDALDANLTKRNDLVRRFVRQLRERQRQAGG